MGTTTISGNYSYSSDTGVVGTLLIEAGASLVGPNERLTVTGDLINQGSFASTTNEIVAGTRDQTFSGELELGDITVRGSGTLTIASSTASQNVTLSDDSFEHIWGGVEPGIDGDTSSVAWNGEYLAVGHSGDGDRLSLYRFDEANEVLEYVAGAVDTGVSGTINDLAWRGEYLAAVYSSGDRLAIYRFDEQTETLTRLQENIDTPSGGNSRSVAWRGDYLAVGADNLSLYVFDESSETLTRLSGAVDESVEATYNSVRWQGDYLAVAYGDGDAFALYRFDELTETLTLLDGAVDQLPSGRAVRLDWRDEYLAVATIFSNELNIYRFDEQTETLTRLDDAVDINPPSDGRSVAWQDNDYLAVGYDDGLLIYRFDLPTETLQLQDEWVDVNTPDRASALEWSGQYLAAGHRAGKYLSLYRHDLSGLRVTEDLAVSGDIDSRSGTIDDSAGSFTLEGGSQTVQGFGTTTFPAFTKSVDNSAILFFGAGQTFSFADTLTLSGVEGGELRLRSSQSGESYQLDPRGGREIEYLDVRDSTNINQTAIFCSIGCTDGGNNINWIFGDSGLFFSSDDDQQFYVGQDDAALSSLSIIEEMDGAAVTAANDIRISIPTTTLDMRFATSVDSISVSGSAASKVDTSVSYEDGGATVVIPVTEDFVAEDTLVIEGLEFTNINSVSDDADRLQLFLEGSTDTAPIAFDQKTIRITGSLQLSEHPEGQVSNIFSFKNEPDATLFTFSKAPATEEVTIEEISFDLGMSLSSMDKLATYVSNFRLYRDVNQTGEYEAGVDELLDDTGTLDLSGSGSTLTFTNTRVATSTNVLLVADVDAPSFGTEMNITLPPSGVMTNGAVSGVPVVVYGDVPGVLHTRDGGGGSTGGFRVGTAAPVGEDRDGGGDGGGSEVDDSSVDSLEPESGHYPPSSTGAVDDEWNDGANAYLSDDTYATTGTSSAQQSYGTFGISLPGSNEVTGVLVKLEAASDAATGTIDVALSWDGGTTFTAPQSTTVLGGGDDVFELGGQGDMWGHSWTVNHFENENFKLRLIANPNGSTIRVDAIQVRPYHQSGGGSSGGGGSI